MNVQIRNVLVPTDFSELGNNALRAAIDICRRNQATLHLIHVVESRYIITEPGGELSLPSIVSQIDADARAMLYNMYESVIRVAGIAVQIHMPTGIPFDEICKSADEMPIDMIIMGAHGASGFREYFIGTTAYNVIRNTTKPVLTIPHSFTGSGFERILFPVRPVPGVKDKFEFLHSILDEKTVKEIHVAVLAEDGHHDELLSNKDELYDVVKFMKQHHLPHKKDVYYCKNYAEKVLELAAMQPCDLIVINATLDYKWTQFFIGPYTQQVVNHSRMPVLCYRNAVNVPLELQREKERQFVQRFSGL